jgi:hypothetical protein
MGNNETLLNKDIPEAGGGGGDDIEPPLTTFDDGEGNGRRAERRQRVADSFPRVFSVMYGTDRYSGWRATDSRDSNRGPSVQSVREAQQAGRRSQHSKAPSPSLPPRR